MSGKNVQVVLEGRTYKLDDLPDAVALQAVLVPDNWPGEKSDCVRGMLSVQSMASLALKKHLAHNWHKITKTIQENKKDGEPASLTVTFKLVIDQSVTTVAAIKETSLRYSATYSTTTRGQTHDLSQPELFDEDMSAAIDPNAIVADEAEAVATDAETKRIKDEVAKAEKEKAKADKKQEKADEKAKEKGDKGPSSDAPSNLVQLPSASSKPKKVANKKPTKKK